MMRIKAYIAAIVTSVVFLLVMPFVPHHHHGSEICLSEDRCDDPTLHDTGHHDHNGHHMPGSPSHCIEKSDYLIDRQQQSALSHLLLSADNGIISKIIPTLQANETELLPAAYADVFCRINATRFYRIGSLRAPPEII